MTIEKGYIESYKICVGCTPHRNPVRSLLQKDIRKEGITELLKQLSGTVKKSFSN